MLRVAREIKGVICIGEGGQSMNVSRQVSRTEHGLYKTEKERESECWARIKRV